MPPTPISASLPWVRCASCASVRVDFSNRAAPESPPGLAPLRAFEAVTGQGGVGGDDAGKACGQRHLDNLGQVGIGKVGGDFQEDRDRAGQGGAGRHHACQHGGQRGAALQVAQVPGIGRRDVDGREIDMRAAAGEDGREIPGTVGAVLVGTEIEAYRNRTGFARAKSRRNGFGTVIVEAKAVDCGAVFDQPEQPGSRVAGLRPGRGGTNLDKAETGARQGGDGGGVLVIACGETNGVQQSHAGEGRGKAGRGDRAGPGHQAELQRFQRQPMRGFGVQSVQNRQTRAFPPAQNTPSGKIWPVAPKGSDLSQMTSSSCRDR